MRSLAVLLLAVVAAAADPEGLLYLGLNDKGAEEWYRVKDGATVIRVPQGPYLRRPYEGPPAKEEPAPFPVDSFFIDKHEVTNAQFRKFVEVTGYVTTAEKKPDWEELKKQLPPGTPKPDDSKLVAGSMVFVPSSGPVPLNDWTLWWQWVPGADWRHPLGPKSSLGKDYDDHPVVHVSWDDAIAYCRWAGKRGPGAAHRGVRPRREADGRPGLRGNDLRTGGAPDPHGAGRA